MTALIVLLGVAAFYLVAACLLRHTFVGTRAEDFIRMNPHDPFDWFLVWAVSPLLFPLILLTLPIMAVGWLLDTKVGERVVNAIGGWVKPRKHD